MLWGYAMKSYAGIMFLSKRARKEEICQKLRKNTISPASVVVEPCQSQGLRLNTKSTLRLSSVRQEMGCQYIQPNTNCNQNPFNRNAKINSVTKVTSQDLKWRRIFMSSIASDQSLCLIFTQHVRRRTVEEVLWGRSVTLCSSE